MQHTVYAFFSAPTWVRGLLGSGENEHQARYGFDQEGLSFCLRLAISRRWRRRHEHRSLLDRSIKSTPLREDRVRANFIICSEHSSGACACALPPLPRGNTKRANQGSSHTDTCRKVIPLGWRRSGAAVLVGQIGATPERQYAHGCMYTAEEIHDNDLRTPPTDGKKNPGVWVYSQGINSCRTYGCLTRHRPHQIIP